MQASPITSPVSTGRDDNLQPTEIRPMQPADLHAVLEIQTACYTRIEPESKASFEAKLVAAPASCFIASIARQPVGYLIALPWDFASPPVLNQASCNLPDTPDCLYLHDLAVAPTARAGGAGRALVAAFFSHLRQTTLRRASLIAIQDSAPYWQRHGFQPARNSDALQARLSSYGDDVQYMEFAFED